MTKTHTRIGISLSDKVIEKLKEKQKEKIAKTKQNVTFSSVADEYLRKGLGI